MPEKDNCNRTPNAKCSVCNIDVYVRPYRLKRIGRIGFSCSRICSAKLRKIKYKADENPKWRGGKTNDHGYLLIYKPDHIRPIKGCYVYYHHLVIEEFLKRPLKYISHAHKDNEVVHHINGNRTDNRLENLSVMTTTEHNTMHRQFFDKYVEKLLDLNYLKWNESKKDYEVVE